MSKIIPYNPKLKYYARKLRKESTLSEVLLWNCLKGKKVKGYQFLRQKPLLNYIVDFYCPKLKLAIEVDGSTHDFKVENDSIRQKEIERYGVRFIRFTDGEIKENAEGAVVIIENWIDRNE